MFQYYQFLKAITNLGKSQIYKVFDMLDFDGSGDIDFDEFYLTICILIAIKVGPHKYIYMYSLSFLYLNKLQLCLPYFVLVS